MSLNVKLLPHAVTDQIRRLGLFDAPPDNGNLNFNLHGYLRSVSSPDNLFTLPWFVSGSNLHGY